VAPRPQGVHFQPPQSSQGAPVPSLGQVSQVSTTPASTVPLVPISAAAPFPPAAQAQGTTAKAQGTAAPIH
ncbi:hypothetical protein U1Q18_007438, partial [Sarracenia purpurea var. burkii]